MVEADWNRLKPAGEITWTGHLDSKGVAAARMNLELILDSFLRHERC